MATGSSSDPLAFLMKTFREQLLEKALYTLVTPGYKHQTVIGPNQGLNGSVNNTSPPPSRFYIPVTVSKMHAFSDAAVAA